MREKSYHPANQPPRLMLGSALLFCGWMQERPLVFLVAAILVESPRWIKRRFEFGEKAFVRAWQLGWLLGFLVFVAVWLDGMNFSKIMAFSGALPLFLVFLYLTEAYSVRASTPLTTFSYFARRKLKMDIDLGRPVKIGWVMLGYPYLILILTCSGLGQQSSHFPFGIAIFVVTALWARLRGHRRRWMALGVFLILTASFSVAGIKLVRELRNNFSGGEQLSLMFGRQVSPRFHQTGIGRIFHLKQTKRVVWRMEVERGPAPSLLREATYSYYRRGMWRNPGEMQFTNLTSLGTSGRRWGFPSGRIGEVIETSYADSNCVRLRGEVARESVLPLPEDTTLLDDLATYEVAVNDLGCVRLDEPSQTVVDFAAEYGSQQGVEAPPMAFDLQIPEGEWPGIKQFVDRHQLRDLGLPALIGRLREIYSRDFSYTLELSQSDLPPEQEGDLAVLSYFLNAGKRGYCEYFAGATALVLRECGYPTRYAVGFSVQESERDGVYLLRGVHAHAWTRVHDGEDWTDVDLTPPDWVSDDVGDLSVQAIIDVFYDLRQRITLWRLQEGNAGKFNQALALLGSMLIFSVIWRLWWAHRRGLLRSLPSDSYRRGARVKELRGLEPLLTRHLGARCAHEGVAEWLERLAVKFPMLSTDVRELARIYSSRRFDPKSQVTEYQWSRLIRLFRKKLRAVRSG